MQVGRCIFRYNQNTIAKIKRLSSNNKIYACVGPCIAKKSYEVDLKFYKKFITK